MAFGNETVGMDVTLADDRFTKIVLSGRLDTPGVDTIETQFVAVTVPAGKSAIVDISRVEFIASMGIRMFISVARSMHQRHAKLAIYGAQAMVSEVLESVSLAEILPVVATEAEAVHAISA